MKSFQVWPILQTVAMAVVVFSIHSLTHYFLDRADILEELAKVYGVLAIASVLIISCLIFVRNRNLDNVGYAFMLLTCIKMIIAYLVLKPLLPPDNTGLSKFDLIIAFFSLLLIETFVTVRLLNKR